MTLGVEEKNNSVFSFSLFLIIGNYGMVIMTKAGRLAWKKGLS